VSVTPLPLPVVEVTVPDCFSPFALGSAGDCRLKLVVASLRRTEWGERLISGPEAAVGTLLHRVLERAGREAGTSPDDIFNEEYQHAVDEIRRDPRRAHFAELASTRSLAEWTRVKAWVLTRAMREETRIGSRGGSAAGLGRLAGAEIGLESVTLRLRGKADRVRQIGSRVFEVRDFKTGMTLDVQGEIKAEIALQLQAYGLMLLERRPRAEVRLVVDDGEEREVPFDAESREKARDVLKGIVDAMPPAGPARADELATPGRSCWGCPIRHVCPAYRAHAAAWWKQYPAGVERLSNDTWGTVLEVLGENRIDVLLRDDAGRRVRVDGLEARHGLTRALVGKRVWFFGLEATGATRGFDGTRFHPRSFHELPRDRLERRAWVLQVFLEEEPVREDSDPFAS
jgi:RecB family exonuclease